MRATARISLIFLAFLLINFSFAQTTETKSPSSTTTIVSGWQYPERAYSSDNSRTYATSSYDGAEQEYSGYGFNIPSDAVITEVLVGVEGYTSDSSSETLYVKLYYASGGYWITKTAIDYSSETLRWYNFTSSADWTPSDINNLKTRIKYDYSSSGGGCYPRIFYIVTWNGTHFLLKNPTEIEVNKDMALCWNSSQGWQLCPITQINVHNGTWNLTIITLNLTFTLRGRTFEWKDYIILTDNHPVYLPRLRRRILARELKVGDELLGFLGKSIIKAEIIKISQVEWNGTVYDIRFPSEYSTFHYYGITLTDAQVEKLKEYFGEDWRVLNRLNDFFGIGTIVKLTYYVDWLPVKVTYEIPSGGNWYNQTITESFSLSSAFSKLGSYFRGISEPLGVVDVSLRSAFYKVVVVETIAFLEGIQSLIAQAGQHFFVAVTEIINFFEGVASSSKEGLPIIVLFVAILGGVIILLSRKK